MNDILNFKKRNKKLLLWGIITAILSIITFTLITKDGGYNSKGIYIPSSIAQNLKSSLITFLIAIPILSLILGLLFSLIPYKKLEYSQKYIRTSLLSLLIINCLCVLIIIINFYLRSNRIEDREEIIDKYKTELYSYKDSSILYFDEAVKEFESKHDTVEVSNKYSPKLNFCEFKIDSIIRDYSTTYYRHGINKLSFDKSMLEIGKELKILNIKLMEYKSYGLYINE